MNIPLEIAFHNTDPSPALEYEIRKRVGKLQRIYARLIGCRVSVEALHHQHLTGNVYDVHIEMRVPGKELIVSRGPHRAKQRYAHPDAHTSLRDGFDAAEKQLKAFKARQRGEVKAHPPLFQGQVAELYPGNDHGFILTNEGTQLYFHRNSLMDGRFERLKRGDAVHFIEAMGDTGPIASKVWLGPDYHLD